MSNGREELNELLKSCIPEEILNDGLPHVYFKPGDGTMLNYPCINYRRKFSDAGQANNHNYNINVAYNVQVISKNTSTGEIILRNILEQIPNSRHDNEYETEGLNHSSITVYYRL